MIILILSYIFFKDELGLLLMCTLIQNNRLNYISKILQIFPIQYRYRCIRGLVCLLVRDVKSAASRTSLCGSWRLVLQHKLAKLTC